MRRRPAAAAAAAAVGRAGAPSTRVVYARWLCGFVLSALSYYTATRVNRFVRI